MCELMCEAGPQPSTLSLPMQASCTASAVHHSYAVPAAGHHARSGGGNSRPGLHTQGQRRQVWIPHLWGEVFTLFMRGDVKKALRALGLMQKGGFNGGQIYRSAPHRPSPLLRHSGHGCPLPLS